MAVKLRLQRVGAKNRPFFRLVVIDSRAPRGGKTIDIVGYYDPLGENGQVSIKEDKIKKWLENGVVVTASARQLLQKQGIYKKQ